MKKVFLLVLTIWAAACILGCQEQQAIPTEPAPFTVSVEDVAIRIHDPAAPVIEALGEPLSYTEETSCAYDGLDKTYYYGSFYLTTCPGSDGDRIQSLWFADDSIATAEGITIGTAQTEVESTYGAECFNGSAAYVISRGESTMTVIVSEGVVTGIRYDGALE